MTVANVATTPVTAPVAMRVTTPRASTRRSACL